MPYAPTWKYRRRRIPPNIEIGRAVATNEERILENDPDQTQSPIPSKHERCPDCILNPPSYLLGGQCNCECEGCI